jgi:hypothetical protein
VVVVPGVVVSWVNAVLVAEDLSVDDNRGILGLNVGDDMSTSGESDREGLRFWDGEERSDPGGLLLPVLELC